MELILNSLIQSINSLNLKREAERKRRNLNWIRLILYLYRISEDQIRYYEFGDGHFLSINKGLSPVLRY